MYDYVYLNVAREVFEDETVHGGPKLVSEERPRWGRYEDGGVAWWISRVTGQPRAMMHDDQIACGYMTSLQDTRYIKSDLNSEKIGKEAPIWGVAQFGEMSNPGS